MTQRTTIMVADITTLKVDAIVNAANGQLLRGAGVCGAIFRAAGPQLDAACAAVAPCPTGQARVTPGFNASARFIIHAVGPVWRGGTHGEEGLLASAYRESLRLAAEIGANSIAFPCISTGIYGFPNEAAARIAIATVGGWCAASSSPPNVIFCCFSEPDALLYRRTSV
jgi:O-acetyl-ADP-ribose deacetylase